MTTKEITRMNQELVRDLEVTRKSTLEKYVTNNNGTISVNWEAISKRKRESSGDAIPRDINDVIQYLEIKGVLGHEGDSDTFFILAYGGLDLSPRDDNGFIYHFKRLEDAQTYQNIEYTSASYPIRIAKNI